MWRLFALLSALFAALTTIFVKIGLKGIDSDLATAIRTAIVLLLACAILLFKSNTTPISSLTKQNWIFLVLSGLSTGLSWLFYFRAIQIGKVTSVSAIDKSSLAITLILSVFILQEIITWKTIFGVALVIAGTLVIVL